MNKCIKFSFCWSQKSCWCCRAATPPEVREQRERERELLELDRDIRTIFAYNLPLKATEQDLFNFFATAGKIVDVKIIMDRNTRRSKGFAYIEYANRVSRLYPDSFHFLLTRSELVFSCPQPLFVKREKRTQIMGRFETCSNCTSRFMHSKQQDPNYLHFISRYLGLLLI